jgi:predicted ribosome quality control (RQC) complex YloA/Tae2 family protein
LPSPDLVAKIQQKQSEINTAQAWSMIKKLEEKLQSQIKLNDRTEEKLSQLENRAIIAEQRLQLVYKYLQEMGVDYQQIHK